MAEKQGKRTKPKKTPIKPQEQAQIVQGPQKEKLEVYSYFHRDDAKTSKQLKTTFKILPNITILCNYDGSRKNTLEASKIEVIADLPNFEDSGRLRINIFSEKGRYEYQIGEGYSAMRSLEKKFNRLNNSVERVYGRGSKRASISYSKLLYEPAIKTKPEAKVEES